MQEFEKRVASFQRPPPHHPVENALTRRIFWPDEEAPARCSFANCNALLDRCMPRARSVDIAASASYLNALVECALLSVIVVRHVRSDQQKHRDVDWPFGAVEKCMFRMPALLSAQNAHNVFTIIDHMPLVTWLKVLRRTN